MKCHCCNKGRMIEKMVSEKVELEGAPGFQIDGLQVLECDKCHDILVDSVTARERTKKILRKLIQYYSPRMTKVPGKVAHWMRHALGLSQSELASAVGGIDPSTFAHAAARNSTIDHYAAFVLLSLCADFVTEGSEGRKLIDKTKKVDKILERKAAS